VTSSIAGVQIPDTRLVADATELVRTDAPPLLFHHRRHRGASPAGLQAAGPTSGAREAGRVGDGAGQGGDVSHAPAAAALG
jgi:hypothetical protein